MSDVDMGIGDPERQRQDEVENDLLFKEFLRREAAAQESTESQQADPPEPAPDPASEQVPAPVEGESSLAPDSPSSEPPVVEPDVGPEASGEEEEEGEPAEGSFPPSTPESPPAGEPAQPLLSYGGRDYTQEDVDRLVYYDNWQSTLSQEQRVAVDLLLSGQYQLAPVGQAPAPAAPEPTPTYPPQPASVPEEDEYLDPAIKSRFDALQTRLDSVTQAYESQQQAQLQAQQQQIITSLDTGRTAFQQAHELSDDETYRLVNTVVGMQVLPSYIAHHNGDYAAAMQSALEAHYWSDPTFRQRELERQTKDSQVHEETQLRTRKMSAITGGGGSTAPRVDGPPPNTKEGRKKAMVDAIASAQNGGEPS